MNREEESEGSYLSFGQKKKACFSGEKKHCPSQSLIVQAGLESDNIQIIVQKAYCPLCRRIVKELQSFY